MITSKVQICNMALSHLGNYGTVENIDTPTTEKEITFSLWYDVSRQAFLKLTMPNFSLKRRRVAQVIEPAVFGFSKVYEYPNDCLKLLGIGEIEEKENNYVVEGNRIYTDEDYPDGLPIRFIGDISDVTKMSPEFKIGLSWFLAGHTAMDITQDLNKATMIEKILPEKMSTLSGLNAQENMPIRISRSRFRQARYSYDSKNGTKK